MGANAPQINRLSTELSFYKNEMPRNVSDNDEKIKNSSVNFMQNLLKNYSSRPWKGFRLRAKTISQALRLFIVSDLPQTR